MNTALIKYEYTVRNANGDVVQGKVDAESEVAVRAKLRALGGTPLDIHPAATGMKRDISFGKGKRVKTKDLAVFARQVATIISSGLTTLRALAILVDQTENERLRTVLRAVKSHVEAGNDLSSAMAKHPLVFPSLMVNMVKAGEEGGFLDQTMLQLASTMEAEVRLKGKVKAAMTYPVVVLVMAILMCIAMLIFVVPVFAKMFSSLGGELPLPTQVLVLMSNSLKYASPLLLVGTIGFVAWWRKYKFHPKVRKVMDPLKLKLPIFGMLNQKIAMSRFARNLGTLRSSGVPILRALDIVSETTGSSVISKAIKEVQLSVRAGDSVSKPLGMHAVFPPMVVQMMMVGEDTGNLDTMLLKIAEFYDQEVEATTEALTALIEPLMIALLGGIVGSMVIALYLPIFKVFDLISK